MVTIVAGLDAPEVQPRPATLLDTVAPDDSGIEWLEPATDPAGVYTSLNCLDLGLSYDVCDEPVASEYQEPATANIIRFVSDMGVKCQSLAFGDLAERFARAVELRESANVELNLMTLRFTGTRGGAAATDITPAGGAVTPKNGVALLEGHAAANYVGQPIIHAPVGVVSVLSTDPGVELVGSRMHTGLGASLVAGAGYEARIGPTGAVAAAGEYWVYATGQMRIRRGRRILGDPILDRATNLFYLRSARPYVIDVDCYLAAVRVKFI